MIKNNENFIGNWWIVRFLFIYFNISITEIREFNFIGDWWIVRFFFFFFSNISIIEIREF